MPAPDTMPAEADLKVKTGMRVVGGTTVLAVVPLELLGKAGASER